MSVTVSIVSTSVCYEVMGLDAMILIFCMFNFKPAFSLSSFTLIKRLFICSSLFAIRVVSSAHLRLLIFLPAILIPAWDTSSLAFHKWQPTPVFLPGKSHGQRSLVGYSPRGHKKLNTIKHLTLTPYSAYKLNKQGDNIQPCHPPFPILNQLVVPCLVLIVASWPAYRFLRRRVRWSVIPKLPQFVMIHIVKGFSVVNETEVDAFLEFLCFLHDRKSVGNLISDSSAFS